MPIAEALKTVMDNIKQSALKAGRNPDIVKLIAVSKTIDIERITKAIHAGATILGENRVQEAKEKIARLEIQIARPVLPPDKGGRKRGVEWHLIGSLQKNKAKAAVQLFDLIHSVDSASLADEINRHAGNMSKKQRILIQVKLADEATKHGAHVTNIMDLLDRVMKMEHISLEGLMTIPPFFVDPEETRPYFIRLREIADTIIGKGLPIKELSMGMSNDYKVAVEEGATMVRIGTSIFGERNY